MFFVINIISLEIIIFSKKLENTYINIYVHIIKSVNYFINIKSIHFSGPMPHHLCETFAELEILEIVTPYWFSRYNSVTNNNVVDGSM